MQRRTDHVACAAVCGAMQVALLLGGIVLHNFIAAFAPGSPTWAPENQAVRCRA